MKIGNFAASIIKRISDNFNRTTSGSLGSATTGQPWDATRGVWFANGTLAQSTDAASSNPIASIPFRSSATLSADVNGGGVGLAFWVTDADNWWASYPNYVQVSNTVFTCDQSKVTNTSNPPSASCCSDVATIPGGFVCDAGYTSSTNSAIFCQITSTGGGGSACNQGYQTQTSTSGFCSGYSTNPGSSTCNQNYATGLTNTSSCCSTASSATSYSCPQGGSYNQNGTCTRASYSTYVGTTSTAAIACVNNGGSYSGGYCTYPAYTYAATATTYYACYTGYTTTPTTYSGYTAYTYYPVVYYGYTSQTQQPTQYSCFTANSSVTVFTYNTQIKMISSVSGNIVTESSTNIVVESPTISPVRSLKVVTDNGQITTTAYSSAGLVNPLGSPSVYTPSSPVQAIPVGIIKTTSDHNQGETLDNFEANL